MPMFELKFDFNYGNKRLMNFEMKTFADKEHKDKYFLQ